jgi:hypothetical protein
MAPCGAKEALCAPLKKSNYGDMALVANKDFELNWRVSSLIVGRTVILPDNSANHSTIRWF